MNHIDLFKEIFVPRPDGVRLHKSNSSRLLPVLEAALAIGFFLAVVTLLPDGQWGLLDLQPHPLWVVVLAIAIRYGGWDGYLAGGLSGLAYSLLLWMQPGNQLRPLTPHEWIQPFLMFAVGAIAGEIVSARERRIANLDSKLREATDTLQTLWERHELIEKSKVELEKQIAFQSNSIFTLADLGMKLQSLDVGQLHMAVMDVVKTLMEVEDCSLYLCQTDGLSLEASIGVAHEIDSDDPLIQRALGERRVVTLRDQIVDREGESVEDVEALMAGPLMFSSGQIYGLVVVGSAPFSTINPLTAPRLEVILRWASLALENAIVFELIRAGYTELDAQWTDIGQVFASRAGGE